jgi:hypothetical protein
MCSKIVELRQQLKESIMLDRSFLNIEAIKENIEDALLEIRILTEQGNVSRMLDLLLEVEALQELLEIKREEYDKCTPCF